MNRQPQVLNIVREDPLREWSAASVAARLGVAPSPVRSALYALCKSGHVVKLRDGIYKAAIPWPETAAKPPLAPRATLRPPVASAPSPDVDGLVLTLLREGQTLSVTQLVLRLSRQKGVTYALIKEALTRLVGSGEVTETRDRTYRAA